MSAIESAFQEFTARKDVAILLINQHACAPIPPIPILTIMQIAEKVRPTVDKYQQAFPALLEIPSEDHPYGQSFVHLRPVISHVRQIVERLCASTCAETSWTRRICI